MEKGGVTCVKVASNFKKLVVAGDDESPIVLNFN
jgi:hypothetical protein